MGFLSFQLNFSYLWPARIFYFFVIINIARLTFQRFKKNNHGQFRRPMLVKILALFLLTFAILVPNKSAKAILKSGLVFRHPGKRHLSFRQFYVHQNVSMPNQLFWGNPLQASRLRYMFLFYPFHLYNERLEHFAYLTWWSLLLYLPIRPEKIFS